MRLDGLDKICAALEPKKEQQGTGCNCTVGDLPGNSARILEYAERARAAGADLVVTPELSLCGYPPEDLLLRGSFLEDCRRSFEALARRAPGVDLVVGFPEQGADGRRYNAAALIREGRIAYAFNNPTVDWLVEAVARLEADRS